MTKRKLRAGSHPLVSGIAAVVSVLAGALASFFTGSIRSFIALPADPGKGTHFAAAYFHASWDGAAFFLLVIVAAGLFAWSKSADSATENEQQGELDAVLRNIESMPPDTFLVELQKQYRIAHFTAASVSQSLSAEPTALDLPDVDQAIRSVLMAIARAARAYDGVSVRTHQANLMLFVTDMPDAKLRQVMDVDHLAIGSIVGYLEGFQSLSVTTKGTGAIGQQAEGEQAVQPDPEMVEIALAVHRKGDAGNLLPGAPHAFHDGRAMHCPSVDDFLVQMEKNFKDRNQVDALRKYFKGGAGKEIKSFFSIPIPTASKEFVVEDRRQMNESVGVLNIQSSDNGILKAGSKLFWPTIYPFALILADLISARTAIQGAAQGAATPADGSAES